MAFEGAGNSGVDLVTRAGEGFLKRFYIDRGGLDALLYKDKVLAMLTRLSGTSVAGGNEFVVPIRYGNNPSVSKTFADAQEGARQRTGARRKWLLNYSDNFGVARVSNKAINASQTNQGSFVRLLQDEVDMTLNAIRQRIGVELFAEKDGVVGTVRSVASNVVTLTDRGQASSFEINQQVRFTSGSNGNARTGVATVTAIDRQRGRITISSTPSGVSANDDIFLSGDRSSTGANSILGIDGFGKWLPGSSTPGVLGGINRNDDPARLSGLFTEHNTQLVKTAGTLTELCRTLASDIFNLTGDYPDTVVCNSRVEDFISKENRNNIRYDAPMGVPAKVNVGMSGVYVNGPEGPMPVMTSPFCPVGRIYVLKKDTWGIYYLPRVGGGDYVHMVEVNGSYLKQSHDAAGVEARVEAYGNLACVSPGCNGVIKLGATAIGSLTA